MKIDDAIKDLLRARKRLESDQGPVARRNARAAITVALRKIKTARDAEFPVARKSKVTRRRNLTPGAKLRRLKKAGYASILPYQASTYRGAGITVPCVGDQAFAPGWAIEIIDRSPSVSAATPFLIRAAKKPTERTWIKAELAVLKAEFYHKLSAGIRRKAIARLKRTDYQFRDAILAAHDNGPEMVKAIVEAQISGDV